MSEQKEETKLPKTLPSEIYIVSKVNTAHGGRSAWMGTQGKYQFTRGGVYKITHPMDVVYFIGNPKSGLDVYLELSDEIDPDKIVVYDYPSDKIDVTANRGGGLGSILEEAQARYERLL